jgi:hypothetical protein
MIYAMKNMNLTFRISDDSITAKIHQSLYRTLDEGALRFRSCVFDKPVLNFRRAVIARKVQGILPHLSRHSRYGILVLPPGTVRARLHAFSKDARAAGVELNSVLKQKSRMKSAR